MVFSITDPELDFLRIFCEIPMLSGFGVLANVRGLPFPEAAVKGLEEKKYLIKDNEGKYLLQEELTFLLMSAKNADSSVVIRGEEKTLSAFILDETIILMMKEQETEIMWLPHLPLLIGAVSGFLKPFLNSGTTEERVCSPEECEEEKKAILKNGGVRQWEISVYEKGIRQKTPLIEIYMEGGRQIQFVTVGQNVSVSCPGYADMVNSITRIIAGRHAESLKKVVEEV